MTENHLECDVTQGEGAVDNEIRVDEGHRPCSSFGGVTERARGVGTLSGCDSPIDA